eukprot:222433_1
MNVKETAEQLLTEYKSTHQQDSNKQFLPLQQYTKENICDMITYVRLTDIFYKKQLIDIMKVFCEKNLNGKEVSGYKGNILKLMVQDDLKKIFITDATIDIMFDYFDKLKEEQPIDFIKDKNAEEKAKDKEISDQQQKPGKSAAMQNEYDGTEKLPCFIQISEVTEDNFTVALSVVEMTNKHRFFQLKEISNTDTIEKIKLKKNKEFSHKAVDFDDFNDSDKGTYVIALYEENKEQQSNAIKLT